MMRTLSKKAAFFGGTIGAALLLGAGYALDRNGEIGISGLLMGAIVAPFESLRGMILILLAGFGVMYVTRNPETRQSNVVRVLRHPIKSAVDALHARYHRPPANHEEGEHA